MNLISLVGAPPCFLNLCDCPLSLFLVVPSSWGCAKTYQCPKRKGLSAPRCMVIKSHTLKQPLGKYVIKLLLGKTRRWAFLSAPCVLNPDVQAQGKGGWRGERMVFLCPFKTASLFSLGLMNASPIDYLSQAICGPSHGQQSQQLGAKSVYKILSRDMLQIWFYH